jgi:hypothetical protein
MLEEVRFMVRRRGRFLRYGRNMKESEIMFGDQVQKSGLVGWMHLPEYRDSMALYDHSDKIPDL